MTNWRALCAELHQCLEYIDRTCDVPIPGTLLDRARTLLSQPEPTDEELDSVMFQAVWGCMDDADGLTNDEMDRLKARAVLTRFARPNIQPEPVSERPPDQKDCDSDGKCWASWDGSWRLVYRSNLDGCYIWWLPHWALPILR